MRLSLAKVLPISILLMTVSVAQTQPMENYIQAANRLMSLMNSNDYSGIEKMFSPEMAAALPLEKSTAFFQNLRLQLGALTKLDPPRSAPPTVLFTAHFDRGLLDLQLSLNQRREIAGLYFKPHTSSQPAPEKHRT